MRRRKSASPSARRVTVALLSVSMLLLLLPSRWTGGLISLVQLLVPLQDAAKVAGDSAARAVGARPGTVLSPEELAAIQHRRDALERQTAALAARVEELENEVRVLTATRLWDAGGRRLGTTGRLIPARVVTADVLPWRASRLVGAGSLQGVAAGAAVVSNSVTVDQGESAGLRGGLAILLGEALVGVVEQVGTHTARVKLLSDPSVQMKVRIGRFADESFALVDGVFWLVGRGRGGMAVRDVERRWIDSGGIAVGDIILSDGSSETLPAAMTIGSVSEVVANRDNPLFVHLNVEAAVPELDLRRVYVYDPQLDSAP